MLSSRLDGGSACKELGAGDMEAAHRDAAGGVALQQLQHRALECAELALQVCAELALPRQRHVALELRDSLQARAALLVWWCPPCLQT